MELVHLKYMEDATFLPMFGRAEDEYHCTRNISNKSNHIVISFVSCTITKSKHRPTSKSIKITNFEVHLPTASAFLFLSYWH